MTPEALDAFIADAAEHGVTPEEWAAVMVEAYIDALEDRLSEEEAA